MTFFPHNTLEGLYFGLNVLQSDLIALWILQAGWGSDPCIKQIHFGRNYAFTLPAGTFHLTSLGPESCQPGVWQSHYRSRRHQRRTSCSKGSLFQHQWHFPGRNWKVKWIRGKGNLPLCEQCYEAGSYSHGSLEFSVHPMSVTKGVLELNHLCTLHDAVLWFSRVKYGWWVDQPSIPREA